MSKLPSLVQLRPLSKKEIILMYGTQGLPMGFQTEIVPFMLKKWGFSNKALGFAHLMHLPWVLKPLLAPLVENSKPAHLIIALQVLTLMNLATGFAVFTRNIELLSGCLFLSNICVAAYDIIVDKQAVMCRNLESKNEVDVMSSFQVIGYRFGSFFAGSFMMFLASEFTEGSNFGFSLSPLSSALITFGLFAWLQTTTSSTTTDPLLNNNKTRFLDINEFSRVCRLIFSHFKDNIFLYLLLFLYKAGETIGDKLLKLFLLDRGMNLSSIAGLSFWCDIVAMTGSCTTMALPRGLGEKKTLQWALIANVLPQLLRALIVFDSRFQTKVPLFTITAIEHFIGGALTVSLFNYMFANVLQSIEGSHYAVFSSIEVLGKILAGSSALMSLTHFGFENLFLCAIFLSLVPIGLLFLSKESVKID